MRNREYRAFLATLAGLLALRAGSFSNYRQHRGRKKPVPREAEGAWSETLDLLGQVIDEANAFRDAPGGWRAAAAELTFPPEALSSLVGVVRLRYRGPHVHPHPRWKTPREGWAWVFPVDLKRPWHVELVRLGWLAARYLDLQIAARHEGKGFFPQVGRCTYCETYFVRRRTDQVNCSPRCRARASEARFKADYGEAAWKVHEGHRKKTGTTKRCRCDACRERRLRRY